MNISEVKDKTLWEDFARAFQPNIFLQSWNWGEFHRLLGWRIFHLGVFEKERLLGAALVVKEEAKRGTYLACPGGPLIDWKNPRLFGSLVRYLSDLGKKEGASFVRVRPAIFKTRENLELFRQYGFLDAPMHMHAETTWELVLSPSEDEILSNMRKNTRYDIRRAAREGVEVLQSKKIGDVVTLCRLQMEAAKRQKFTPFSKEYLESEFRAFAGDDQVRLFLAKFEGKVLSAAMIIFYGDTAFYHHGASTVQPAKISSSHLLLWEAVREAKRQGCRIFNFWGIAPREDPKHPWAGLTFFKKGFGGQRVEYFHAQDLPLNPFYWLTYLFETARRLKRGL